MSASPRHDVDLTEAAVSGVRWISVARGSAEVVLFGSMVVLARLIPPAEFGRFAIALIMQELALAMLGEGVGNALVQRESTKRAHLQAGLAISLTAGVGLALLALVAGPALFAPLFDARTGWLVQLSAPMFPLAALGVVPQAVLQRQLAFRRLGLIQVASVAARAVTSLTLAVALGLDAPALVLGAIAAIGVTSGLNLWSAPVPPPRLSRRAVRDISGYGLPAAVAGISWTGFRNADYAVIAATLGAAAAGLYWRAFQLAVEYQKKISQVMYQVAFPVLARTETLGDLFALRHRMVRLLGVVLFPLLTGLAVLAPVVVPWLFGPAWKDAVVPTQVLTIAGGATFVIDAVGATLMAAGRPRALLGYGWGHFAVYAVAVLLAAPAGITAVSIAACGVHLAFLLIAYVVLFRSLTRRALGRLVNDVGPGLGASAAMALAAVPLTSALRDAGLGSLEVLAGVAVVAVPIYVVALRALFPASWRDLRSLLRRSFAGLPRESGRRAIGVRSAPST